MFILPTLIWNAYKKGFGIQSLFHKHCKYNICVERCKNICIFRYMKAFFPHKLDHFCINMRLIVAQTGGSFSENWFSKYWWNLDFCVYIVSVCFKFSLCNVNLEFTISMGTRSLQMVQTQISTLDILKVGLHIQRNFGLFLVKNWSGDAAEYEFRAPE